MRALDSLEFGGVEPKRAAVARVAVIFDNLGPYHRARLEALNGGYEVLAVEVSARSREYGWTGVSRECRFKVVGLGAEANSGAGCGMRRRLECVLDEFGPQVLFIPGWSSSAAFAGLAWGMGRRRPVVVMCESGEADEPRVGWKEWVKRRVVRHCATGFAGGRRHAEYLARLGMPHSRIFPGYDAVDNDYFEQESRVARGKAEEWRARYRLPARFFLASARFIAKKNLARLIQAYGLYRNQMRTLEGGRRVTGGEAWDLVLLGDGPLRSEVVAQIAELNLRDCIHVAGFRQYADLPVYYGLAGALVHASTTEPWGLVVNEAMASGLPVVVSNRCGCVPELVWEGRNGFVFDPWDVGQLAGLMGRVAGMGAEVRRQMGEASQEIAGEWGLERFARGFGQAFEAALRWPGPRGGWIDRVLLRGLMRRRGSSWNAE